MSRPFFLTFVLTFAIFGFSRASILTCSESAVPPIVKGEGVAERTGDIALNCSGGAPGAIVDGNLSVFLNVNITKQLSVHLDGRNLNNPKLKYYALNQDQPRAIYTNGRQFYLTATYEYK